MKTLELKTIKIVLDPIKDSEGNEVQPEPVKLPYKDLLISALKNIPQGGMDLDTMDNNLRVLSKIKKAKGKSVELDDADVDLIHKLVVAQKFNFVDQGFVDYRDHIIQLKNSKGK